MPTPGRTHVYTDTTTLLEDFQCLLTHPLPHSPTISVPPRHLSLPPRILSTRSFYFRALLSSQWGPPLTKPNTTVAAFQDVLEYLITAAVSLSTNPSSIAHNISVLRLSHELLIEPLEAIVANHLSSTLSRPTLCHYLHSLYDHPLPPLETLIAKYLSRNPYIYTQLPPTPQAISLILRIVTPHPPPTLEPLITYITTDAPSHILAHTPPAHHPPIKKFLYSLPPLLFSHFESLFPRPLLIEKYRTYALSIPHPLPPPARILFESTHPHCTAPLPPVHVRVPGGMHAKIDFDPQTRLAPGTELGFYLEHPKEASPQWFIVGGGGGGGVLAGEEFWIQFGGDVCDVCLMQENAWGWRFFVQPIEPELKEGDAD